MSVDPIITYEEGFPTAVIGSEADGGFAQYLLSAADRLHDVSGSPLTDAQLACLPTAYGTAMGMINRAGCTAGERVLVTGSSGGVGMAAEGGRSPQRLVDHDDADDPGAGNGFHYLVRGRDSGCGGGGGLVPDGGFEAAGTAGLQPPWFAFENGGTVSVSDVNSNGGTYAARLQADASSGVASFPILKVERLGAGTFAGGEPVTITFDVIDVDTAGVGKVFVAEFFTERADPPGGATNEVILGGYGLTGSWQTLTFSTNLGADAANGVSLLFKADCGANTACTMDVFIDNVSIEVN